MRLFCWHFWKLIGTCHLERNVDNRIVGNVFYLQCQKCGDIKERRSR